MAVLTGQRVLLIGGGSGIGLACARAISSAGARVTIAGRNRARLEQAAASIGKVEIATVDLLESTSVEALFKSIGPLDHLVLPGSDAKFGGIRELSVDVAHSSMESKFWGPYRVVKAATLSEKGSIVLFSGAASRRPSASSASLTAINAAVEALGKALALELAPVRVNVVSPGLISDTGWSEALPLAARRAMFEQSAKRSPLKRVGRPQDVADVVLMLLTNLNMTGAVIDVDAGALLV
jgi:NAD(P)-dependent dehydrogenase (short-subunit alcohol dehydrogenase family)